MSTGKVVLGALAGLATGAILGILFAPDKGKSTRKKISDKTRSSIDELKDKYDDIVSTLGSKVNKIKEDSQELYEDGKDLATKTKNKVAEQL